MPIIKFNNYNEPGISKEILEALQTNLLEMMFPIGSRYVTQTATNPASEEVLGFGTWERLKGKICIGLDENDTDFDTIGKEGGSKTHQHMLPIAIDTTSDNWNFLQWNNAFGYGVNQITSPNYNSINNTPTAQSKVLYQLKTSQGSNIPPYKVVGYVWIRTA